ncbi:alpha/beta fold hydrolase [Goodfellowiella coeruleoviolacea]|uniref:Alpha/beta hydrolase family protein n=1 Tax=Goodfellowiella coeruleoviolacea TaxID=334858 RepID=A0AAE3GI91_9PSEU|nr:alpha/beta hydrolase [Goodfellowiella coeruleoviolacea]MCP2167889.1 Alpha/beta hydrolase family protein [Goodfellowiella coeruleoviolacea]
MDFLLIHGTTQSPAGWRLLSAELVAAGHRAHAVDLVGIEPDLTIADYAAGVARWWRDQPRTAERPVVVAHSGSGPLLAPVAAEVNAAHQVWLAAYVPDTLRPRGLIDEASHEPGMFNHDWWGKNPVTDPVVATEFLFHDCDQPTLAWALSTMRLFHAPPAYQEPPTVDPAALPSTYVLPTLDRTLRPDWMRRAAEQRLRVRPVEISSGHCPHVSRPAVVAQLLMTVAQREQGHPGAGPAGALGSRRVC